MSAPTNPAGKKYNFKVKMVLTDLIRPHYLYQEFGIMGADGRGESPIMYQNSRYISKLFYINNVSGGILAKDKVEDMPERYKRFINTENPSAAELAGSFIRELADLANREEIGQNVFYSRLSDSAESAESSEPAALVPERKLDLASEFKNLIAEIFPGTDPSDLDAVCSLLQGEEDAYGEQDDFDDGDFDDYEDYAGEEIKDILHLNNYYNSEEYKMSRAEYNFDVCGEITFNEDGALILKYDESELTGYSGSYIQLMFDPQKRDAVTIRRNGYYDSWLFLELGKRIQASNADNYTGAALAANTRELTNNITAGGGEISVVYITETNGFPTEMIYHTINAEPAAD